MALSSVLHTRFLAALASPTPRALASPPALTRDEQKDAVVVGIRNGAHLYANAHFAASTTVAGLQSASSSLHGLETTAERLRAAAHRARDAEGREGPLASARREYDAHARDLVRTLNTAAQELSVGSIEQLMEEAGLAGTSRASSLLHALEPFSDDTLASTTIRDTKTGQDIDITNDADIASPEVEAALDTFAERLSHNVGHIDALLAYAQSNTELASAAADGFVEALTHPSSTIDELAETIRDEIRAGGPELLVLSHNLTPMAVQALLADD